MSLTVFINAGPWLPVPPSGYGGVENMLMYLIGELRGRGHRVILGTVEQSEIKVDQRETAFWEGQHPQIDAPYSDAVWVAHKHMHKMASVIRKTHDAEGIDVVHDFLEIVGPTVLAELGPGTPPVLHTLQWNLRLHEEFYRDFDGRGRVFFNGISEPQMAAATGSLRATNLGVVHNGVDVNDFTFREDKDDYVITLARFASDKGQDIAARICERLRLPLLMAGTVGGIDSPKLLKSELSKRDSPFHYYKDVEYYRRSVRPYERRYRYRPWRGRDRRIEWIGSVGGEEKRELVAGARALLMPIRWEEPFGMAVIEALASGTPVVAMRHGAMPVILQHGYNGFLADSEQEFEECLQRVRSGEIQPGNCRRSVEERFSAARMADRYVRLYEQVIERSQPAGSAPPAAPLTNGSGPGTNGAGNGRAPASTLAELRPGPVLADATSSPNLLNADDPA
jgi:glycosyltransferase involved in cell wall biosynthesis